MSIIGTREGMQGFEPALDVERLDLLLDLRAEPYDQVIAEEMVKV